MIKDRRRFFAYLNLFIAAMLLLVLGDSYLNLYVGWEGVGLASYLLIGFWNQKPAYATASKKAFVMNRVGDMGLSFAIMIAFATMGTVSFCRCCKNMHTTHQRPHSQLRESCLLVAAAGKSAQFPLQALAWRCDGWPNPSFSTYSRCNNGYRRCVLDYSLKLSYLTQHQLLNLLVVIVGAITLMFGAINRYR